MGGGNQKKRGIRGIYTSKTGTGFFFAMELLYGDRDKCFLCPSLSGTHVQRGGERPLGRIAAVFNTPSLFASAPMPTMSKKIPPNPRLLGESYPDALGLALKSNWQRETCCNLRSFQVRHVMSRKSLPPARLRERFY